MLAVLKDHFMYCFENGLGKGDSRQRKNVISWVACCGLGEIMMAAFNIVEMKRKDGVHR